MKQKRIAAILSIVDKENISSQEELLNKLKEQGFELTQATLSRDLKSIKIAKFPDGKGGYIYMAPGKISSDENQQEKYEIHGFVSIEFSHNLGVIKTLPGYGNSVASVIDSTGIFEILGTVAGDDTILLVLREGTSGKELKKLLGIKFPEIQDRL